MEPHGIIVMEGTAAAHGTSAHGWPRLAERAFFTFWCLWSSWAPSPASVGPSSTQAMGLTLWESQAENFGSAHSAHFCQHAEPLVREPLWCSPAKLWEQGHPESWGPNLPQQTNRGRTSWIRDGKLLLQWAWRTECQAKEDYSQALRGFAGNSMGKESAAV